MKLSTRAFFGTVPRRAENLLTDTQATAADNTRMTAGTLRPLNTPSKVSATLVPLAKSIYSLGSSSASAILSWAVDVDVARSPVSDSEYKVYYTGDGLPKKTSYALATGGVAPYPFAWYYMGTPAPTTAPTLAATTGSVGPGTYAYLFTYVTKFGSILTEESAPSPAALITLAATGGVTVTFPVNPSTAGRNYVYKRVYRAAATTYQLVAEIPFADASYTDALDSASIPGTALPSLGWTPPPDDLQGICALPSGVMVGFRSNEIWFSEPGFPHAWPSKYMQAMDSVVVGVKAFGNNVAVATQQHPYLGTGLYPDSFTFTKLPLLEPCVSKRSMASDDEGCVYVSRNGLVSIGMDGADVVTKDLITRQGFANYTPESMLGVVFEGRYYGFYTTPGTTGAVSAALVVDRREPVGLKTVGVAASAAALEVYTNQLFYVDSQSNQVNSLDPVGGAPMTYVWKSKRFQVPAPVNFAAFQVLGDEQSPEDAAKEAATAQANAAITTSNQSLMGGDIMSALGASALNAYELNGSTLQTPLPSYSRKVSVAVFAAGSQIYGQSVQLNAVYRLPGGFKALNWQFQLTGQVEVSGFEMATSVAELKQS